MALVRIERNPTGRQLGVFAATWLAVFAAIGYLAWDRGAAAAAGGLWALAAIVPAVGAVSRRCLRGVYVGMCFAAWPVGAVVSILLLAAVYYLVLTPIALVARGLGRDPMRRRFPSPEKSCWVPRPEQTDIRRYFRQF